MPKVFDVDAEVAKAKEKVNRGIGQRVRHAKAETKRLADAARSEINTPVRIPISWGGVVPQTCDGCYWQAKDWKTNQDKCRQGFAYGTRCREYRKS